MSKKIYIFAARKSLPKYFYPPNEDISQRVKNSEDDNN